MILTPELVDAYKQILADPAKQGLTCRPLKEVLRPSGKVTPAHLLFKDITGEYPALPKIIFYILMDEFYPENKGKAENKDMGYALEFIKPQKLMSKAPFRTGQKVVGWHSMKGSKVKHMHPYLINDVQYRYCSNGDDFFWYVGYVGGPGCYITPRIFRSIEKAKGTFMIRRMRRISVFTKILPFKLRIEKKYQELLNQQNHE